jgi:hypothetical protein
LACYCTIGARQIRCRPSDRRGVGLGLSLRSQNRRRLRRAVDHRQVLTHHEALILRGLDSLQRSLFGAFNLAIS